MYFHYYPCCTICNIFHVPKIYVIAVCIYRYVITFGLRSKYDVLGHYFRFMIVLPSINKFNMTSHQLNMTYVAMLHSAVVLYAKI